MKTSFCRIILFAFLVIFAVAACAPYTGTTVVLSRTSYVPKIKEADFLSLQGKRILLWSILDESQNTTNLAYFNPEKTVGYRLYYGEPNSSMAQPVVSFFWYTLKKGFEQAGVVVVEDGPLYDAELLLKIKSLTDEEIQFSALASAKGQMLYQKDYTVKTGGEKTTDTFVLQDRAYGMFDRMVSTIMKEPQLQQALTGVKPSAGAPSGN